MQPLKFKRNLVGTVMVELFTKIPLYGFEFLLASWLVLNQYAEWVSLGLIYRMAPYAHLGALSYFNKRYPLVLGAQNVQAAEKIQRHTNSIFNQLILVFFCVATVLFLTGYLSLLAFIVVCGVLSMQVFTYCQAQVRNEGKFFAYAVGLIVFSLGQFFVAYYTVHRYGVFAAAMSTFLAYLAAVFYYLAILKMDYIFLLPNYRNFKRIIKMGWPPFLLTISSFLTQISDRVALVCLDDKHKLAFYGFFAIFFQIGIVAINSLGKVLSPYIFYLSGHNKQSSQTLSISLHTCTIILLLYIGMSIALFEAGDWFINSYFAKFNGALLGVYNYATIGILMSLTLAFYPQLMIAGKEFILIKINFAYFLISVSGMYVLAYYSPGVLIYSFGSFLLNGFYSLIVFNIIETVVNKKMKRVRWIIFFIFMLTLLVNYYGLNRAILMH